MIQAEVMDGTPEKKTHNLAKAVLLTKVVII